MKLERTTVQTVDWDQEAFTKIRSILGNNLVSKGKYVDKLGKKQ